MKLSMNKPNILFIMCDQMRHDALGCNGNTLIKTPNIDRLASMGMNFAHSFTPAPICVPARASLTTGCYPHKCTGDKDNFGVIREGYPLLGEELQLRGYETYAAGKLHYNPYMPEDQPRTTHGLKTVELAESGRILQEYDPEGKKRGLEDYHDYLHTVGWGGYTRGHGLGNNDVLPSPSPIPQEYYVDTWVTDRSIDMMSKHLKENQEKPFFMWASFPKPHSAFDPPRPYDQMYDPREMPVPVGSNAVLKERGLEKLYHRHYEYNWDLLSPEAEKVIKAYYFGLISHQDKQVGRLLDFVESQGIQENTIIVFTSDHGEMLGDFGLYFKKCFFNGSVRVPLMISYPGHVPEGVVSQELVGLQDILPTLIALTGEPLNQNVDGHDLSPVLFSDTAVRDVYISQCDNNPNQQYMAASKDWKYIYHQIGGIEELYDQRSDPNETNNLAAISDRSVQEAKAYLRNYLISWCQTHEDNNMLQDGNLTKTERELDYTIKKNKLPFGRRFY